MFNNKLFILALSSVAIAGGTSATTLPGHTATSGMSQVVQSFLSSPQSASSKMHVTVSSLAINDTPIEETKIESFYENGVKKILLNDKEISEEELEAYQQKNSVKNFKAPSYDAFLTADEIQALLNGSNHVYIDIHKERFNNDYSHFYNYTTMLANSKISTTAFANNYKGNGVGVYFTETGCPSHADLNVSYYIQGDLCPNGMHGHPTGVARILQTTAPQAMVYGFDQTNYPNPDAVTPAIQIGSHSWSIDVSSEYTVEDMNMDNYIYCNKVTNFVAAGNKNDQIFDYNVASPGKAVNAITVGAVDPVTHIYTDYSMWENSNVGNQKPEIANYTNFIFPGDSTFTIDSTNYYNGYFDGPSASTPYTAALAADIMQQHPEFKRHPEVMKAFLLSHNGRSIFSPYSHDQDNNSLAAIDVPWFNDIPEQTHTLNWFGNNDCCFSNNGTIEFTEQNIVAGHYYQIAIAWLTPGSYIFQNGYLSQDIDLYVYQGNTPIGSSTSGNNPFEIVGFTAQSSENLRIVIKRYSNSEVGKVALGYNIWHY